MPNKITGTCKLCSIKNAVYRCPKCYIVYCSLSCYKTHKEQCVQKEVSISSEIEPKNENILLPALPPLLKFTEEEDEKDRVKHDMLGKLGESDRLKAMLCNKNLSAMIKEIDNSTEPGQMLEKAMQIPVFTEFVDECLKIVEPDDVDKLVIECEEGEIL